MRTVDPSVTVGIPRPVLGCVPWWSGRGVPARVSGRQRFRWVCGSRPAGVHTNRGSGTPVQAKLTLSSGTHLHRRSGESNDSNGGNRYRPPHRALATSTLGGTLHYPVPRSGVKGVIHPCPRRSSRVQSTAPRPGSTGHLLSLRLPDRGGTTPGRSGTP